MLTSGVVRITAACCLSNLGFGLQVGFSSPSLPQLAGSTLLPEHLISLFASLTVAGAILATCTVGTLTERIGRRNTLRLNSLVYLLGWLCVSEARVSSHILTGRFLTGFAGAVSSVVAPVYEAEISPKHCRGALVTMTSFAITLGVFLGYFLGIFLSWRQCAWLGAVEAIISLIALFFVVESPRYLVTSGDVKEAKKSLSLLCESNGEIDDELTEIHESITGKPSSLMTLFTTRSAQRPLAVAAAVMILQTMTGILIVMHFMSRIFSQAGYSLEASLLAPSVIVGLQLFSVAGSGLLVDRVGRVQIMVCSGLGMAASHALLGCCFYFNFLKSTTWLPFVCVLGFKLFFGVGWGPLPHVISTELFSNESRGSASAFCHLCGHVVSFLLTYEYPILLQYLGYHGTVWCFAVCCVVASYFAAYAIPETKGQSLEKTAESMAAVA